MKALFSTVMFRDRVIFTPPETGEVLKCSASFPDASTPSSVRLSELFVWTPRRPLRATVMSRST